MRQVQEGVIFHGLLWLGLVKVFASCTTSTSSFLSFMKETSGFQYKCYQRGITCNASAAPLEPKSIEEIQTIVKLARQLNVTVKAVGNLHSVTDCICTEGIVLNMTNINGFTFNDTTKVATAGGGLTLGQLTEKLHLLGRALESAPSFADITVGGAIGTGAHGSSLRHPSTLSDQIVSMVIVNGLGDVVVLNENLEDFRAFRVHLGVLGVVYNVSVKTTEQYKLTMKHYPLDDGILWEKNAIINRARAHDNFQFWWFPMNKKVVISEGNRTDVKTPGNCETHFISEFPKAVSNAFAVALESMQTLRDYVGFFLIQSYSMFSLYKLVPARSPYYTEADGTTSCMSVPGSTGYSHKMMTNGCKECFWKQGDLSMLEDDSNVGIPLEELPEALKTIQKILDEELVLFPLNGLYFRFLKSSDALLAMNSNREIVSIEWITVPRRFQNEYSQPKLGLAAYQAIGQALIKKHKGRPHWGKNGLAYQNPNMLKQAHTSNLPTFVNIMKKYDPFGTFMNHFGMRIREEKNEMTATKQMIQHCALQEFCFCNSHNNDTECGNEGVMNPVCKDLLDTKVCQEDSTVLQLRNELARLELNSIVNVANSDDNYIYETLTKTYTSLGNIFSKEKSSVIDIGIGNLIRVRI